MDGPSGTHRYGNGGQLPDEPCDGPAAPRARALALVNSDNICGSGDLVESARRVAQQAQLDVEVADLRVGSGLAVLLAAAFDIVIVAGERQLRGWMDMVRERSEVWTLDTALCWPRGGGRPYPLAARLADRSSR